MSQPENAWAIAEELMSQNMLDVPIHIAAPVIAKVLASRAPAEHDPARAPHNKLSSLWCDACPRPTSGTPAPQGDEIQILQGHANAHANALDDYFAASRDGRDFDWVEYHRAALKLTGMIAAPPPADETLPAGTVHPTLAAMWKIDAECAEAYANCGPEELRKMAQPRGAQAAAPGGKEPAPDWCDVCNASQMVVEDGEHVCGLTTYEAYSLGWRRGNNASHPLQDKPPAAPSEQLLAVAKAAIVGTLTNLNIRDISEIHIDAFAKEAVAQVAGQDKPPAAPLCGKRIPETGLGCTLEPGHQGRHDVDVTKVSEAPTLLAAEDTPNEEPK